MSAFDIRADSLRENLASGRVRLPSDTIGRDSPAYRHPGHTNKRDPSPVVGKASEDETLGGRDEGAIG